MRVFEMAGVRKRLREFAVDLPTEWARAHQEMNVRLDKTDPLDWHASLEGDDNERLLGFPVTHNVDRILLRDDQDDLPVHLSDLDGDWSDLDQGWWGRVIAQDTDVYIAEADLDSLLDEVKNPKRIARLRPGVVSVDGVEVLWNRVSRAVYDEAWQQAINEVRSTLGGTATS